MKVTKVKEISMGAWDRKIPVYEVEHEEGEKTYRYEVENYYPYSFYGPRTSRGEEPRQVIIITTGKRNTKKFDEAIEALEETLGGRYGGFTAYWTHYDGGVYWDRGTSYVHREFRTRNR